AANIAEGFRKRSKKDKINFYNISQGSLDELEYYLILSADLRYCKKEEIIVSLVGDTGKMLGALINSIEKRA
ncbi:MAG: four helix bundle protein, partial [Endomicrobiia bacterium]|nr:four helix bundle protein [Endomicrobiia bacterium]